jgi:hypothetical protein
MLKNFILYGLKRVWKIGGSLFWVGLSLFGLGVLAWYTLHWGSGDRFGPVRLVNYFMPVTGWAIPGWSRE